MKEVLMVLPKKTVKNVEEPADIEIEVKTEIVNVYADGKQIGKASIEKRKDYGIVRDALVFDKEGDRAFLPFMASVLGKQYELKRTRYPLYIKLDSEDLEAIALLSRIGFIPYFGEWNEASASQSEEVWTEITEALREWSNHARS